MADVQDHWARYGRSIPVGRIAGAHAAVPVAGAAEHRGGPAGKKCTPLELTLPAEDTITFVNDDLTIRNIYSDIAGQEFEIKHNTVSFGKPGSSSSSTRTMTR